VDIKTDEQSKPLFPREETRFDDLQSKEENKFASEKELALGECTIGNKIENL